MQHSYISRHGTPQSWGADTGFCVRIATHNTLDITQAPGTRCCRDRRASQSSCPARRRALPTARAPRGARARPPPPHAAPLLPPSPRPCAHACAAAGAYGPAWPCRDPCPCAIAGLSAGRERLHVSVMECARPRGPRSAASCLTTSVRARLSRRRCLCACSSCDIATLNAGPERTHLGDCGVRLGGLLLARRLRFRVRARAHGRPMPVQLCAKPCQTASLRRSVHAKMKCMHPDKKSN